MITAPFNNMWTLKFKAQLANALIATVTEMFGGAYQLPTMLSELFSTIWLDLITALAEVGGWDEPLNRSFFDDSEKRISFYY